jgi:hypothetical protein
MVSMTDSTPSKGLMEQATMARQRPNRGAKAVVIGPTLQSTPTPCSARTLTREVRRVQTRRSLNLTTILISQILLYM